MLDSAAGPLGLRSRDWQVQRPFVDGLIEKRSIDYIPLAERHGKVWHLWPVWFSGGAHLATVATGVVGIALGGNFLWMSIAVVLGAALGTFFMAFHSTQGPQLGLPQMIQSRPQFGYVGALLVWGVALLAYIGYNAFNQVLAEQTLHSLYGAPPVPTLLVFALASLALAIVGYDLIHIAQRWIAYVLIVALLVFSVALLARVHFPAGQLSYHGFRAVPFLAQFFAAAAYQVSWSIYVSDYSRYLPSDVGVSPSFLVDLSRRFRRRLLDHARRHRRGRALSEARGRRSAARCRGCGDPRARQAAAAVLAAGSAHHHDPQLLRRIAHALERRRLAEAGPPDPRAPAAHARGLGRRRVRPRTGLHGKHGAEIR